MVILIVASGTSGTGSWSFVSFGFGATGHPGSSGLDFWVLLQTIWQKCNTQNFCILIINAYKYYTLISLKYFSYYFVHGVQILLVSDLLRMGIFFCASLAIHSWISRSYSTILFQHQSLYLFLLNRINLFNIVR